MNIDDFGFEGDENDITGFGGLQDQNSDEESDLLNQQETSDEDADESADEWIGVDSSPKSKSPNKQKKKHARNFWDQTA